MAAVVEKLLLGSAKQTLLTGTNLNALANNALFLGSAFNNTIGQTGDGYVLIRLTLTYKFQVAPTANTSLSFWFIKSDDGAGGNYEEGAAGTTPTRPPDVTFGPLTADTNAHNMQLDVECPVGLWKPLLKNDGTGQTLTANNIDNVLYGMLITRESV